MKYPDKPVLLVDDEELVLDSLEIVLNSIGISNIIRCSDPRMAESILKDNSIELVLLDILMPHLPGDELLKRIKQDRPEIPAIMISAVDELEKAVSCMRNGAFDYIVKPVNKERLTSSVQKALEARDLRREIGGLREKLLNGELKSPEAFSSIVTQNKKMLSIFRYCETVAPTNRSALISGETGTGKELIAKALHQLSGRSGEFVPVNAAGLSDQLFSDAIFGHAKGAFTGADSPRRGLVKRAAEGTLFLDEIADLNEMSQVKLLRLLEKREYAPLGSDAIEISSARIIAASNRSLPELVDKGKFRKDLYYRLFSHCLELPPLRERLDDIPFLLDHFLKQASLDMNKKVPTYHPELISLLKSHSYPGNVRELKAMAEEALSHHDSGMLSNKIFNQRINSGSTFELGAFSVPKDFIAKLENLPSLSSSTRLLIDEALRRSNGNQTVAAKLLGISKQALSRRLKNMK